MGAVARDRRVTRIRGAGAIHVKRSRIARARILVSDLPVGALAAKH